KPEELIEFYNNIPEQYRNKMKICVDTCHVFAAGFQPLDFINVLISNNIPIGLIHFNDSKLDFGCKKDRHEEIGKGYIGLNNLIEVARFALDNNIDLVKE